MSTPLDRARAEAKLSERLRAFQKFLLPLRMYKASGNKELNQCIVLAEALEARDQAQPSSVDVDRIMEVVAEVTHIHLDGPSASHLRSRLRALLDPGENTGEGVRSEDGAPGSSPLAAARSASPDQGAPIPDAEHPQS